MKLELLPFICLLRSCGVAFEFSYGLFPTDDERRAISEGEEGSAHLRTPCDVQSLTAWHLSVGGIQRFHPISSPNGAPDAPPSRSSSRKGKGGLEDASRMRQIIRLTDH
ncbi:S-adenosyl-methyltransferase MraW [Anopheles sinensis]|uniref:S-adenosyl-methyltransferase MraW n=1 Tax=Anopheles sinensis TaxID=74873 RepID=A0A084VHZ5_ANOSI|nr:S-adenosyl-methyltransferase MraW [Anopheles sinensis]